MDFEGRENLQKTKGQDNPQKLRGLGNLTTFLFCGGHPEKGT